MTDITNPSYWTSTYANTHRDRRKYISPHPGQPMYHFADAYDPSHWDGFNYYRPGPDLNRQQPPQQLPPVRAMTAPDGALRFSQTQPIRVTVPGQRSDLWGTQTRPMTGTYSNRLLKPIETIRQNYNEVNYDSGPDTRAQRGRNKYHVPGYMGFVRGQQFRHG